MLRVAVQQEELESLLPSQATWMEPNTYNQTVEENLFQSANMCSNTRTKLQRNGLKKLLLCFGIAESKLREYLLDALYV